MAGFFTTTDPVYAWGAAAVMIMIFFSLIRAVAGPTAPDRVVAINIIGTKTVVIITLISWLYRQELYLDIAMVYAMMSFIATIGVAKYLEKGALKEREREVVEMFGEAIATVLFAGGLFFLLVGTAGLLRLPDAYCRLHATTKCDTMGAGLVLLSLAVRSPWPTAAKLGLIVLFILITNPTAAHVIARAAYVTGHRPWAGGDRGGGGEGADG